MHTTERVERIGFYAADREKRAPILNDDGLLHAKTERERERELQAKTDGSTCFDNNI